MGPPEVPPIDSRIEPGAQAAAGEKVEVVYALPQRQCVVELPLSPAGITAREAVELSGLLAEFPELGTRALVLGIHGTVCDGERPLRDGDRVEIYRPLKQDPRALRRERAASATRAGRRR